MKEDATAIDKEAHMHRATQLSPSSGLPATLVGVVGVLLATGCNDGQRHSTPTGPPDEPSHIALLLPAVQQAREAARPQQAPERQRLRIEQRLFKDGHAVGTASLVDDESGYRLQLVFREGSIGCTDDVPFVHLLLSWHTAPAGQTADGGGIPNSGTGTMTLVGSPDPAEPHSWTVVILPFIEQGPDRGVPERIEFVAELEVLFLEDPCAVG